MCTPPGFVAIKKSLLSTKLASEHNKERAAPHYAPELSSVYGDVLTKISILISMYYVTTCVLVADYSKGEEEGRERASTEFISDYNLAIHQGTRGLWKAVLNCFRFSTCARNS